MIRIRAKPSSCPTQSARQCSMLIPRSRVCMRRPHIEAAAKPSLTHCRSGSTTSMPDEASLGAVQHEMSSRLIRIGFVLDGAQEGKEGTANRPWSLLAHRSSSVMSKAGINSRKGNVSGEEETVSF
jgi:hypothetical protein